MTTWRLTSEFLGELQTRCVLYDRAPFGRCLAESSDKLGLT
jgi:hypothetical protein